MIYNTIVLDKIAFVSKKFVILLGGEYKVVTLPIVPRHHIITASKRVECLVGARRIER